ncbi:MAG: OmpA family protein [Deltaproteobacteria bacterium]|nr:OmpA family protein [Deltaproteobacteria bacterium]
MERRALPALLLLAACHSGPQIRASADIVKTDTERARRSGAMRCAPRELAAAEANLDFTLGELDQGNSLRAHQHLVDAEAAAKKAVLLSKDCAPKQVLVKEQPRLVVKIEETDKDGDGVLDKDDNCPMLPGPVENKGCPVEAPKDKDGDGILDNVDRCPDQPEDMDQWQDEDGCPEPDNDGDGVRDLADKCPNEAGPIQNLGCPVKDKDGDGIPDDLDRCPNEPEDKDGFQDEDGCPDLDNDADGIADAQDKCPDKPEDKDGFEDEDGCPELDNDGDGLNDDKDECPNQPGPIDNKGCPKKYTLVAVTKDKIEIKKQIKFATGSARIIGAESQLILSEVAQALKDNPQIKRVRVEGHTDSVGADLMNLKLSQKRADSVKAALLNLGIDPGRLEAVGFGETKPIASNSTAGGRQENRRTEFNIIEQ